MNNSKPVFSAIAAGHMSIDMYPDLTEITKEDFIRQFVPGRLVRVGPAVFSMGGSVSNTGLALNRFGVQTTYIAKIGQDYLGEIIQSILKSVDENALKNLIIDPNGATSYSVIINPKGMDRIFLHNPGANNTFVSDDITPEMLRSASLFHFGYPPLMEKMYQNGGAELSKLFRRAKEAGLTTSLDLTFVNPDSEAAQCDWRKIFQDTLPFVDLFLPSLEEALLLFDPVLFREMDRRGDVIDQADDSLLDKLTSTMISMGCAAAMIKMGHRGIYLKTGSEERFQKTGKARPKDLCVWADKTLRKGIYPVKVVGTTGAGDTCIAGFLSAFLRGLSPEASIQMAAAAGACCCESLGTNGELPNWEQLCARVDAWEKKP